jgi:hypothetical protein
MSTENKEENVQAAEEEAQVNSPDAEILEEEPRNLLLALVSQIRPGMDLSKITLPTFILEPRSMLEKLTDFMTHGELLALVPKIQDPVERMVGIVKWYLSGFYIKPQGVKKPYNPILGEFFRTKWTHEDGTTTHYVAEQTSHHPPISSLYISNREAGFMINGSIFPRSKFLRFSVASFLDGTAILTLLESGEVYTITFPTVYGRGIIVGTLLMELCGNVTISCEQTQCKAEIEFKEKGFFTGEYNVISGKIKQKKDTLYTITGKWDGKMDITKNKKTEVLWDSKDAKRVPKVTRPLDQQEDFESQKLWINVTNAIKKRDQKEATAEKSKLEDAQRKATKERSDEWVPRLFRKTAAGDWTYRYINYKPYSPSEGTQEEEEGIIYMKGVGKQATIEAEEATFKAINDKIEAEQKESRQTPDKKPGRTFSSSFLKGSGGVSKEK